MYFLRENENLKEWHFGKEKNREKTSMNVIDLLRAVIEGVLVNVFILFISRVYIRIQMESLPFDISGYWYGIASEIYQNTEYRGLDFYKIKFVGQDRVRITIFQFTSEQKYHKYIGTGYFRADRLMISYEEKNNSNSRMVGNLALRFSELKEHTTCLTGTYVEFRGNNDVPISVKYSIKPVNVSMPDKICMLLSMKKWIRKKAEKFGKIRS